jgi:hypothetical protein
MNNIDLYIILHSYDDHYCEINRKFVIEATKLAKRLINLKLFL